MESVVMAIDYLSTPIGKLKIIANDSGLLSVKFVEQTVADIDSNEHTQTGVTQLTEYFSGKRRQFDLTLTNAGTTFQNEVWQQLMAVPFGETASYQDIANNISKPKAVRAVGTANAKNPIFIIIPCHRVIGANGSLTGYAGGIDRKLWLLKHEGAM
ncbi:MAG: methylated-DNA-[protein]-cysteine S-methyltransferase [Chitinophagales bacterium]|jgi:methylated-DNA-[protein]-cysteine S-methyltransferase